MATAPLLTPQEFAGKIRAKYPGAYDGVSDAELTQRVIAKYPQYADSVKTTGGAGGSWEPEDSAPVRFLKGAGEAVNNVLRAGAFGVHNEVVRPKTQEDLQMFKQHGIDSNLTAEQEQALPHQKDLTWQERTGVKDLQDFARSVGAADDWERGDYAAALGKMAANVGMIFGAHRAVPEELPATAGPEPTTIRQSVATAAQKVSDAAQSPWVGIVSPRAAHAGKIAGRLANALKPEEQAPAPSPSPSYGQGTRSIKLADIQPVPKGETAPAASTNFAEMPKAEQPQGFSWQSLKVGKVEGEPSSAPITSTRTEAPSVKAAPDDAADLAKALGFKSSAQAEARYGADTWGRMVKGRDAVASAVDDAVSPGPINEAAKNVAGAAIAAGDVPHAEAVVNAAAKQAPIGPRTDSVPLGFKSTLKQTNPSILEAKKPSLTWEDILDDKAWKERFENDFGTDMGPAPQRNWADTFESQQAKAQERMVPLSRLGRAIQTEAVKQNIENTRVGEAKSTLGELAKRGEIVKKPKITPSQGGKER